MQTIVRTLAAFAAVGVIIFVMGLAGAIEGGF